MGFYFNSDSKIHINLSDYAWNIVYEDMFNFYRDDMENISGFVNNIIENFYEMANSSIQLRCDEISSDLEGLLTNETLNVKIDGSTLYSVIDLATKVFVRKTLDEISKYFKGSYRKIKLRKWVADYLRNECEEDKYYDGNVGNYIKALVEEYSKLPYIKREYIHCKENIDMINKAITLKKQLRIKVRSGNVFEAIPYKIETDKLGIFSYLVGVDSNTRKPVTFRISKVKIGIQSKIGKIIKQEEECLEKRLLDTDVSFLSNDRSRIVVRLDEYGIKKYNSQLHLRPSFVEKGADNRYIFDCSEDQIKYYFIKFGSNAVIEEPKELADYFKRFYTYALKNYQLDSQHN